MEDENEYMTDEEAEEFFKMLKKDLAVKIAGQDVDVPMDLVKKLETSDPMDTLLSDTIMEIATFIRTRFADYPDLDLGTIHVIMAQIFSLLMLPEVADDIKEDESRFNTLIGFHALIMMIIMYHDMGVLSRGDDEKPQGIMLN